MSLARRLALAILVFTVPLVSWYAWERHVRPALTGDEPHYLVIADSIGHDLDVDLANNYADPRGIRTLYPNLPHDHAVDLKHNGKLRPVQGLGLGVILSPVARFTHSEVTEFLGRGG